MNTPLVELEHPVEFLNDDDKSPKSTALPVVAISTESMILETEGVKAPAKQTLVGEVTPAAKLPDTVLLPKSIELPVVVGFKYKI